MRLLILFLAVLLFGKYPLHKNITVTYFFVGELPSKNNKFISNIESAWDDMWLWHYGGVDNPFLRKNYFPKYFIPNENPFYCALPYNDLYANGKVKPSQKKIPWYKGYTGKTICKNRWVKIIKHTKNGDKIAYAQWEDSGPNLYNDFNYVFLNKKPKNKFLSGAGIDVSPAVKEYLGLKDVDKVDWQFVDENDVPFGPWKMIITKRPLYFKNLPRLKWKYIGYYPSSAKNILVEFKDVNKIILNYIKKHKKKLICYIDFTKTYKNEIDTKFLGNNISGKYWVDIRKKEVLDYFIKKIKKAREKGCRAILAGGGDMFLKNSGFFISAVENIDYLKKIATVIKENGMYAGLKNYELCISLAPFYDFAIYYKKRYYKLKIFEKLNKPLLRIKP